MFTGLIGDIGTIRRIEDRGSVRRAEIACRFEAESIAIGASIACGGPCLTAVAVTALEDGGSLFTVEIGAETLDRTTAHRWATGHRLNLERSLRIGDELGGHLVTGHIDAVGTVLDRQERGETVGFTIGIPRDLARFVATKGSIALDGTSLTVNAVSDTTLDVLMIPHSLAVTTWNDRRAQDAVNVEVDLMARYAARLSALPTA